jgi:MFS family permease
VTDPARRRAFRLIVAFGIVSLLADVVYEGARSILGPYLLTIGASAAAVGVITGLGEFVGFALRVVTGRLADRTGAYWTMTIAGYVLTVVAVPLLGLVGRVDLALALVVAERLGKAVRSPARDTLIASVSEPLGRGLGFGLHEAIDQLGAVIGPLLLAGALALRSGDYRFAFGILAVPGVLVVVTLLFVRRATPVPPHHAATEEPATGHVGRARRYLVFVFLSGVGFAPFPLIAFHLTDRGVLTDAVVPLVFALGMAVDAGVALVTGRAYDRRGLGVLLALPMLSIGILAAFSTSIGLVWIGAVVWGAVLGIQESTLRAAVGDLSDPGARATAYGVFNAVYGIALMVGGAALGLLYDVSIGAMAVLVITAQGAAMVMLRLVRASS